MDNNKVVLAYSGGLDTSYCVKYLQNERGLEVYTALVNTGGFSPSELKKLEEKALTMGAKKHVTLEKTEDFYQQAVKYLVYGNVMRNGNYPLSVSAERMFQALAIAEYARDLGATYVAHGSTGAGNDQVRFDLAFQILAPEVQVITPIRELQLSRQEEIAYLKEHGVNMDWSKGKYSINQGLWGTSVGGAETLTANQPLPEEAWPVQVTAQGASQITLQFTKGQLTGLNGEAMEPVKAIRTLEKIAAPYGVGRDIHVGDTIIGLKGRVGFAAAAPTLIIKAHQTLEKHTLTKWQMYWKEQLGNWYGMLLHEGQWLEPVMRNIEAFLESTQTQVSGEVYITLQPYRYSVDGISSPHDLMGSDFGDYGEMNRAWSGEDVQGFTKILANAGKIYNAVNGKQG